MCSTMVEDPPSTYKALDSMPSTVKKKRDCIKNMIDNKYNISNFRTYIFLKLD